MIGLASAHSIIYGPPRRHHHLADRAVAARTQPVRKPDVIYSPQILGGVEAMETTELQRPTSRTKRLAGFLNRFGLSAAKVLVGVFGIIALIYYAWVY
jgi:hypothetical protein